MMAIRSATSSAVGMLFPDPAPIMTRSKRSGSTREGLVSALDVSNAAPLKRDDTHHVKAICDDSNCSTATAAASPYRTRLACAVLAPFSQFVDRLCTVGLYLNEVGFDLTQDLANSDTEHSLTALNEVNYLIV